MGADSVSVTDQRRPGPLPLVLHIAMARSHYAGAQAALQDVLSGRNTAGLDKDALAAWREVYGDIPQPAIRRALGQYCEDRLKTFLAGVERYQTDHFKRPKTDAKSVFSVGAVRVLSHGGTGAPVLLVPSLINPSWVLDLMPGRSFASYLVERGLRVYSIDWGMPGDAERRFLTQDYVMQRLVPALEHIVGQHGPAHVAGYCLGGNLALAAALNRAEMVRSLCAIATPWDFAVMGPAARRVVAATHEQMKPILAKTGLMPAEALQALFAQLDPTQIERKFAAFANLDPQDAKHRAVMNHFIAVEDWSNEGPPLVEGVVEDCFGSFYQDNAAMAGDWHVGGRAVLPADLSCPSLVIAAGKDKIVPPASTMALADQLPGAHTLNPQAGHVGMMVGSKAKALCWAPVADWLNAQTTL